jgi:uncharacterized protein (TIGR03437 family)
VPEVDMPIAPDRCGLSLGLVLLLGTIPSGSAATLLTNGVRPAAWFEPCTGPGGQTPRFLSRGALGTLFLMPGGDALVRTPDGALRMTLAGMRSKPAGTGMEPAPGVIHNLTGGGPDKWRTRLPVYSAIRFERVYPGIDLVYRGSGDRVEYDFVLSPGADPAAIALEFSGADQIELNSGGDLVFSLGSRSIRHLKPVAYQTIGGARREVAARYVRTGAGSVRFEIGGYDRARPLVIDPVLAYATFLGGAANDGAFSMALDPAGNILVAGITASASFPIEGFAPKRPYKALTDAFVAKLNPQGTSLLYITYLGGSDQDAALAIATDAQGNAYLTGGTNSTDFPVTASAPQTRFGGTGGSSLPPFSSPVGDAFAAKLDASGTLMYSSYLGGSAIDQGYAIAVDASGSAVIAGATASANFPVTAGVFQPARRGYTDAFVTRINPAGTALVYSTYLGGSVENYALALALDSSGNAYAGGITRSTDFPVTSGAFQSGITGGAAGFLAKLNATATSLAYATYLGGDNYTYLYGVAVDSSGSAYATGTTTATDFPLTAGAYNRRGKQGGDVFVTRLAPDGRGAVFSSVFGGNGPDFGRAIALDAHGAAYVTGSTKPYGNGRILDFPTTPDATQRCGGGNPAGFLFRLSGDGASLEYSSYLGAAGGATSGMAIALGSPGIVHIAGSSGAAGFPATPGALQPAFGGGGREFDSTNLYPYAGDAFLARVDLTAPAPFGLMCQTNAASMAPNLVSPGEIVSFFGSGIGPADGVSAALDAQGRLPTVLAGTRVLFDGMPAPLLFVRSDQVNTVAPFSLAGKTSTEVRIEYAGGVTQALTIPVTAANPGIFTLDSSGSGQAAALNQDGSYNLPSNPASPGSIVVLFATGAGVLDPVPEDGRIVQGNLPRTAAPSAYVGGCLAEVIYSGSAPGLIAGSIQFNLRIPDSVPPPAPPATPCGRGDVPVVLLFGGAPSQTTATIRMP